MKCTNKNEEVGNMKKIKRKIAKIMCIAVLVETAQTPLMHNSGLTQHDVVSAESNETIDEVLWKYTIENDEVCITGCESQEKEITVPSTINGYMVTSIGKAAFSCCESLTSVTIPKLVTYIGIVAFSLCISLTAITIPEGVTSIGDYSFFGCSSLTEITIPEGVTLIDGYAFNGCSSMMTVTLPKTLASIDNSAFEGCSRLKAITIPEGVTSIGDSVFLKCSELSGIEVSVNNNDYTSINGVLYNKDKTKIICYPGRKKEQSYNIPKSVTSIAEYTFYECSELKTITIPEGVTSIGEYTFSGCSSLTTITIPEGITDIGEYAFSKCSSLTTITLPEELTSIGKYAFSECSGLTTMKIPEKVKYIDDYPFDKCSSLISVEVSANNKNFTSENGVLYNSDKTELICYPICKEEQTYNLPKGVTIIDDMMFSGCSKLKTINIPEGVTNIDSSAFLNCSELENIEVSEKNNNYTSINGVLYSKDKTELICYPKGKEEKTYNIPQGIITIGSNAFYGCSGLTEITIPKGVTTIKYNAFHECSGLTTMTIPEGVDSINYGVFSECSSLTEITLPETLTMIPESLFIDCNKLKSVKLPEETIDVGYKAFYGCSSLTSITIPEGVANIGFNAFGNCTQLSNIEVSANNKYYTSENGVLYNKNKTKLICYPKGKKEKSYEIPQGVISVIGHAFYGCSGLMSVTFPKTLNTIEECVFSECSGLDTMIFKGNKPEVYNDAFDSVSASAYYPAGDTTWTKDGSLSATFGGAEKLTWAVYDDKDDKKGDINRDGELSVSDLMLLKGYLLGISELTDEQFKNADTNSDSWVNIFDLIKLKYMIINI